VRVSFDLATGKVKGGRAKIDAHILEGTRGNTATSVTSLEVNWRKSTGGTEDNVILLTNVLTITREGGVATIEDGGLGKAGNGSEGPVPVLLKKSVRSKQGIYRINS
jgi:hypothetical protein